MTELRQEFAVLCELQNVCVARAVAADPDVAFVINGDSMIRLRPLIARAGAAPVSDEISRLIELKDRRSLGAARARRRVLVGAGFAGRKRVWAMDNPDVILCVDRYPDSHSDVPVIRQRLRPQRIDFKSRCPH